MPLRNCSLRLPPRPHKAGPAQSRHIRRVRRVRLSQDRIRDSNRPPRFHSVRVSLRSEAGRVQICVNDNSSSVDDWLKSAGAKFIERATDMNHDCFEFEDALLARICDKFAADNLDDETPRQIKMAKRIEDFRYRRNLASLVTPHSVMHINGRRRRRGTMRPITAAAGVEAFRRTLSAFSRLASATHSSRPPLVCASVNRIWPVSSVPAQSTRTVAPLRLSGFLAERSPDRRVREFRS